MTNIKNPKSNGFKFNHLKLKINDALGISEAEYNSIHNKSKRIASAPFIFPGKIRTVSQHIEWAIKNENIENLSPSTAYLVGFLAGERFSLLQITMQSFLGNENDFEDSDTTTDGKMVIIN